MRQFTFLDEGETAFFLRELESIKSRTYDIKFPPLAAQRVLPVDTSGDPGAEFITYTQYEMTGKMKIVTDFADDLPSASTKGKQFTSPVVPIGGSYSYNLQEIRASAMANKSLEIRKAQAARRAYEQTINDLGLFGSTLYNLKGFFNHPDVTRVAAPVVGGNRAWADKSAAEVLDDMVECFNSVRENTLGTDVANTLILPLAQHTLISNTRLDSGTDTTIKEFFLMNNPGAQIMEVNEAKAAGIGVGAVDPGADIMVAYNMNSEYLTLEIPSPFEQLPVQEENLSFKVPTYGRCAGSIVYYPKTITIYEGI